MATSAASSAVQKGAFRRFMDSPAGPKTIHFWAPAMKWVITKLQSSVYFLSFTFVYFPPYSLQQALVFASIGDLQRPAEKLSLTQNMCKWPF